MAGLAFTKFDEKERREWSQLRKIEGAIRQFQGFQAFFWPNTKYKFIVIINLVLFFFVQYTLYSSVKSEKCTPK